MDSFLALISFAVLASPALAELDSLAHDLQVKLLSTHLSYDQQAMANALVDGDTQTVTKPVSEEMECVLELPELSSPKTIVVHLQRSKKPKVSAQIELWGSIVSAESGYQLLRAVMVQANRQKVIFDYLPVAARWLMLRVSPDGDDAGCP